MAEIEAQKAIVGHVRNGPGVTRTSSTSTRGWTTQTLVGSGPGAHPSSTVSQETRVLPTRQMVDPASHHVHPLRLVLVRQWVSLQRHLHREGLADKFVSEFLLAVEGSPDGFDLVAQELMDADLSAAEMGGYHEYSLGGQHSMDLPERNPKLGPWKVLDRVERHDSTE